LRVNVFTGEFHRRRGNTNTHTYLYIWHQLP